MNDDIGGNEQAPSAVSAFLSEPQECSYNGHGQCQTKDMHIYRREQPTTVAGPALELETANS